MISRLSHTLLISSFLVATLLQADMEEAKEMFDGAKCMDCHTPSHFQHREKKVSNYTKLSDSVKACATSTGAEWFDEDSDIVTEYLNKEHYHYKTPPKKEDDDED